MEIKQSLTIHWQNGFPIQQSVLKTMTTTTTQQQQKFVQLHWNVTFWCAGKLHCILLFG